MKQHFVSLFISLALLLGVGCQSKTQDSQSMQAAENTAEASDQANAPSFADDETDYLITIETRHGNMKAILFDATPQHKENFVKLASEGFFDGTLFHRVIPQFMIQGGDPTSKGAAPNVPLGNGGPDYTIPAEFRPELYHVRGALAAARKPDQVNPEKASSGSQFYVVQGQRFSREDLESLRLNMNLLYQYFTQLLQDPNHLDLRNAYQEVINAQGNEAAQQFILSQKSLIESKYGVRVEKEFSEAQMQAYQTVGGYPPLDGDYTVFGKVIDGLDVIDKIAAEARTPSDRPLEDVPMTVRAERVSKREIYEKYGYDFSGM